MIRKDVLTVLLVRREGNETMKNDKLYYICTPYSRDIAQNLKKGAHYCNKLLDLGYLIYSPIHHSHPLDVEQSRDPQFWYDFDLKMLDRCDVLVLCPGWSESTGCNIEKQHAEINGIKIVKYEDLIE